MTVTLYPRHARSCATSVHRFCVRATDLASTLRTHTAHSTEPRRNRCVRPPYQERGLSHRAIEVPCEGSRRRLPAALAFGELALGERLLVALIEPPRSCACCAHVRVVRLLSASVPSRAFRERSRTQHTRVAWRVAYLLAPLSVVSEHRAAAGGVELSNSESLLGQLKNAPERE
jgi:hypothetical protein